MGTVADAALDVGGEVTGVLPRALADKESARRGLTDLGIVGSLHERKAVTADLEDAVPPLLGRLRAYVPASVGEGIRAGER